MDAGGLEVRIEVGRHVLADQSPVRKPAALFLEGMPNLVEN